MHFLAFFPRGGRAAASPPLALAGLAILMSGLLATGDGRAQEPGRRASPSRVKPLRGNPPETPFGNPQEFMERFWGKDSNEDRKALEKVPISPKEEQRIGAEMLKSYLTDLERRGTPVLRDGLDVDYLRQLVNLLRPQMKNHRRYPRMDVYLADSPQTDARSFPGGALVFFRGLLDFAESEAALVGVVGHELSHLDRGHQLGQVRRMKLAQQAFQGQGANFSVDKLMQSGALMMRTFARPFRPEEEEEADQDGVRWCYRAGYDPRQLAELFLHMHRRDGNRPAAPLAFFQTHPFHIDRYEAVLELDRQLRQKEPQADLYIGRTNIERRIPREQQRFPE